MIKIFIKKLFNWRFGKLHSHSTHPIREPLCQFENLKRIYVGSRVRFLRGAVILADNQGKIELDDNVIICRYTILQSVGGIISIGKNSLVGDYCNIFGQGGLTIGEGVMIASGCRIIPNEHTFDIPDLSIHLQPCHSRGIVIEDGVWIGANVVVLDGVHIGRGAIVGAGSVVKRSIPAFAIAVGVPARVVKMRPGHEKSKLKINGGNHEELV